MSFYSFKTHKTAPVRKFSVNAVKVFYSLVTILSLHCKAEISAHDTSMVIDGQGFGELFTELLKNEPGLNVVVDPNYLSADRNQKSARFDLISDSVNPDGDAGTRFQSLGELTSRLLISANVRDIGLALYRGDPLQIERYSGINPETTQLRLRQWILAQADESVTPQSHGRSGFGLEYPQRRLGLCEC
jgi:hypothetical protein